MKWIPDIKLSESLYLKDPNSTDLGQKIVSQGIIMMEDIGLEEFTFNKLAKKLNTTEASIYRYFENKHLLLLYILNWYWNWMEFLIVFKTNNLQDKNQKLDILIDIILFEIDEEIGDTLRIDKKTLHLLAIKESSKSYLNHNVEKYNELHFFQPYKSLCHQIASILADINSEYPYPKSLATTLLLMSRNLYFFMNNFPSMADFSETTSVAHAKKFFKQMVLSSLSSKNFPVEPDEIYRFKQ